MPFLRSAVVLMLIAVSAYVGGGTSAASGRQCVANSAGRATRRPRRPRWWSRRRPGDDAEYDRLARRRADPREARTEWRGSLTAAGLEQCARWNGELRVDCSRRRRGDRQRPRRRAALDVVEHSGGDEKSSGENRARQSAARWHAADQRQRAVLSRPGRTRGRADAPLRV